MMNRDMRVQTGFFLDIGLVGVGPFRYAPSRDFLKSEADDRGAWETLLLKRPPGRQNHGWTPHGSD